MATILTLGSGEDRLYGTDRGLIRLKEMTKAELAWNIVERLYGKAVARVVKESEVAILLKRRKKNLQAVCEIGAYSKEEG